MRTLIALSALVLAGTTAPAIAEGGTADAGKTKQVCKTFKETGSRLGGKKVCMTEEQWVEQRRVMKEQIERAQTTQVNKSGT